MSDTIQAQRTENTAKRMTLEDAALQYIANNSEDPLELKASMITRNVRATRGKRTTADLLGDYYFRQKRECEAKNEGARASAETMLTEEVDPVTGIDMKGLFPQRSARQRISVYSHRN